MVTLRALPIFLAASVLLGAFVPLLAQPVAGQAGPEYAITEGSGDVRFVRPELQQAPGAPASPATNALDVISARVFGETGVSIIFEVHMHDMKGESYPTVVIPQLHAGICFKYNGVEYAIHQEFRTGVGGMASGTLLHKLAQPCTVGGRIIPTTAGEAKEITESYVTVSSAEGRITISVPRELLGDLSGEGLPKKGDTISDLFIMTWDHTHTGGPIRYDAMPDAGPDSGSYTLSQNTGVGGSLKAIALSNSGAVTCGDRKDAPVYAFEAGGKRGIPVVFQNLADASAKILFTVENIEGSDWGPRIVPQLNVRPFSEVGNVTVTVILDTPTASHKECAVLRVRGTEEGNPDNSAEILLSAVAVLPPNVERNLLYFHIPAGVQDVCGARRTWLNTLEDDPMEGGPGRLMFKRCDSPNQLSTQDLSFQTGLDVNPNNDLVLNTSAVGKQAILHAIIGSEYMQTRARFTATLISQPGDGGAVEPLGTGSVEATVSGSSTPVDIPINIDFTRDEVPTGDPSRIAYAADGLGFIIRYEPLGSDAIVTEASTAGQVSIAKGTHLELPIFSTIQRNLANPGEAGSLISLKASDVLPEFVRPGGSRIFNYTVLNEGANADVAVFEYTMTGAKGWSASFLPSNRVPLQPGESKVVQVALTAPATANESESIVFEVIVASELDPTARSSLAAKVIATNEAISDNVVLDVDGDKGGFLPAPGALTFFAAVAVVALALRPRRR